MKLRSLKSLIVGSEGQILDQRSDLFIQDVLDAQDEVIRNLENESRTVKKEILNLTDLHRTNTTSLTVADNVNPTEFVNSLQALKLKLAVLDEKLYVARETMQDFTGDSQQVSHADNNQNHSNRKNNKRNNRRRN